MKGLTEANLQLLLDTAKHRARMFPREDFREKLIDCDRAYYMYDKQRKDADDDEKKKVKSRYEESGLAIVSPAVEAEVAFMYALFLSDPNIFSIVSSPQYKDLAKAIKAANLRDATHKKWLKNLLSFFRDNAKYNLGFVATTWDRQATYIPTLSESGTELEMSNEVWEGNSIKRLDPYNVIFDHSVVPSELAEEGEFFAHFEAITQVRLYKMLEDLKTIPESEGKVYNDNQQMWTSTPDSASGDLSYYEVSASEVMPEYLRSREVQKSKNDWLTFAGVEDDIADKNMPKSDSLYQIAKFYFRIIPKLYDCDVDEKDKIQIWKVIIVNGQHVVFVGRETNAHALLPVGASQPVEDSLGHNTLGMVQSLRALQKLGKQLKDRRLAALDRAIGDKAFYDPNAVAEEHMHSEASDAKIPLKKTGKDVELKNVYMPIPFTDPTANLMGEEIRMVKEEADEQSGINKASRGQFVKGNKTLEEYNDVMSNADSKQYVRAAAIESQAFSTIKHILKWNLVQKGKDEKLFDPATGEVVDLKRIDLRKAVFDFKLTDGLNPSSKFLNAQETIALFQTLQVMSQQENMKGKPGIDMFKLLSHVLLQGKNIDLEPFMEAQQTAAGGPPAE